MTELVRLRIGAADVDASGGGTFERRNPVSGDVATCAAAATPDDAVAAVEAAAAAFPAWAAAGPGHRRDLLLAAAATLKGRADEFVAAALQEAGATAPWAQFNLGLAAGILREAASLTTGDARRDDLLRCAGQPGDGGAPACRRRARHRPVERPDHSRRAGPGHPAGGRQHGCSRRARSARASTGSSSTSCWRPGCPRVRSISSRTRRTTRPPSWRR